MATLNLCQRMAIVAVPVSPEQVPITDEFEISTGDIELTQNQQFVELHIPDPGIPLSDVTITVTARIAKYGEWPNLPGVQLLMPRHEPLADLFVDEQTCGDPVADQHFMSVEQWKERVALQPAGEQDSVSIWACVISYVDTPGHTDLDCEGAFVRIDVAYPRARTDPDEVLPTWHIGLVTPHKTLVANSNEERGVPHFHQADFAIDRRTGKLVVVSRSADDAYTVSGGGVAQADANGNQIDTHGLPGTFQSIAVGRLKGNAVRFTADGQCAEL